MSELKKVSMKHEKSTDNTIFSTLTVEESLNRLETSWDGLSEEEALRRRSHYGKNTIKKRQRFQWAKILLHQFKDILVWILGTAAFFSLIFGEFNDTAIILIIIIVNAGIGFIQEYKAERILDRLQALETDTAIVIRDNEKREIDSKDIVPGDILFLDAGTTVPADARILESFSLKINTALFTGESQARKRDAAPMSLPPNSLTESDNMVLTGESVATGEARILVVATGNRTELGHLADLTENIQEEPTPLQRKMARLGRNIAFLSLAIGIVVIAIGHQHGLTWYDNFLLALALAVSIVPEGLPAAISIAFALGMKRLLKVNILAKRLNAVETLGSITTICTDKTGTLTKGELTVTRIILGDTIIEVSGDGYEPRGGFSLNGRAISPASIPGAEMLFRISVLANNASVVTENGRYKIVGDGTEGALLIASRKYHPNPDFFRIGETKITENPFASDRMRMSTLFANSSIVSYVKGSPESILRLSSKRLEGNRETAFSESDKQKIHTIYDTLSKQSLRVIAFAYRNMDAVKESDRLEEMERNLVWVGMMAMTDPPRPGTKDAIEECRALGLRVIMITGDYEVTARAIARSVKLITDRTPHEVINGKTLATTSDETLIERIRSKDIVFARTTPEQKLRIATILKQSGEVIAMTGDGVNDAPALKKADIGIAMGIIGTDVSKEAADMILLDDNFSGIVRGIREGRNIYANLKKSVHYVFTSNVSELFTVLIGFGLGIPSPIAAVQILAIDLGTDVFPSLALGVEPEEPKVDKTQKKGTASIIDREGVKRLVKFGTLMAIGGTVTFLLSMIRGGWQWGDTISFDSALYQKSTAATYATLALTQMANLLQSRSATLSFFAMPFFSNPWIWISMTLSLALLVTFTSTPIQSLLAMQTPDILDWTLSILFAIIVFTYEELRKREAARREVR